MGLQIIIRKKNTFGKTRAEQESNLRKDGRETMPEESFDKLKWIEKKIDLKHGMISQSDIDKVK